MSKKCPADMREYVTLALDCEEAAAVEGWRLANDCATTNEAIRVLLRLGLLSEIAKTYDDVISVRDVVNTTGDTPF